jgi:hypothetical protein
MEWTFIARFVRETCVKNVFNQMAINPKEKCVDYAFMNQIMEIIKFCVFLDTILPSIRQFLYKLLRSES